MSRRGVTLGLLAVVMLGSQAHAATCESLRSLAIPRAAITLAETVAPGAFSLPASAQAGAQAAATFKQLPGFCRVAATLQPSADSDIGIEVWMPLVNWNGKFQGVGNGGFAGVITYTAGSYGVERGMAEALKRGYATASTDTGHTLEAVPAFLQRQDKLIDFGYRAVHEMTVAARAIIAAFHGSSPKRSYWNGCSTGGRQGLMEAQRFPADYDGIIAGAPANPQTRLAGWNVYVGRAALEDPARSIPASKYPAIHRAVLNACDALDGVKDDLIADPSVCRFDFKTLACNGTDSVTCLTASQLLTAEKVTSPAIHSRTGETIFPGLALGTELGWATKVGGPAPNSLGTDYYKYVVFKDPAWDWRTFDLESAVALADRIDNGTVNATSSDLTAFRQRNGKLLLYHGWRDQNFSAQATINYYKSVRDRMGGDTADWMRLFLAPGMGHCGGGEGPNAFDAIGALDTWVEGGKPPDAIVASHRTEGKVDRTRPLCPYPQVAKYRGAGSSDQAENFSCSSP